MRCDKPCQSQNNVVAVLSLFGQYSGLWIVHVRSELESWWDLHVASVGSQSSDTRFLYPLHANTHAPPQRKPSILRVFACFFFLSTGECGLWWANSLLDLYSLWVVLFLLYAFIGLPQAFVCRSGSSCCYGKIFSLLVGLCCISCPNTGAGNPENCSEQCTAQRLECRPCRPKFWILQQSRSLSKKSLLRIRHKTLSPI